MITEIKLTPKEAEVIRHRLGVTDAMAEVFGPSGDNVWQYDTDAEAAERLESILADIVVPLDRGAMALRFDGGNDDHIKVMDELVDGNTMDAIMFSMIGQATDEPLYREGQALKKHLRNLNQKWEQAGLSGTFDI